MFQLDKLDEELFSSELFVIVFLCTGLKNSQVSLWNFWVSLSLWKLPENKMLHPYALVTFHGSPIPCRTSTCVIWAIAPEELWVKSSIQSLKFHTFKLWKYPYFLLTWRKASASCLWSVYFTWELFVLNPLKKA